MKKLLKKITVILVLILISCNNDENNENKKEQLIGNWEYVTMYENDKQITARDCKPSTIEITPDGNRTDIYYNRNNYGECIVVETIHMTWKKLNNNLYEFTHKGLQYNDTVKFENDNNTLILVDSDTDGYGDLVYYKFVYNRIN